MENDGCVVGGYLFADFGFQNSVDRYAVIVPDFIIQILRRTSGDIANRER